MKGFWLILFMYVFYDPILHAQNETTQWYFGYKAGLDFMTNPPTILSNGQLHSGEGCTSIADSNGSLLFYTVGDTVWNNQHQIMANGTGLFAHYSVTQSSLIVKKPGSTPVFYLFTLNSSGGTPPTTLYYSEIDMNLASGNGSVTVKNTSIQANCSEKLSATKHCNGQDVWVVVHGFNSVNFFSFLVTTSGVNPTPVLSNVPPTETSFIGQMKISPSGRKIALASNSTLNDKFLVFDFDNFTGLVSNPLSLITSTKVPYGCEFSNDGSKLYGSFMNGPLPTQLVQWDLCSGTAAAIVASSFVTTYTPTQPYGALQLAKDGKIYFAAINQSSISVIHNPNTAGIGCNFANLYQSVSPKISKYGLPNFVSSYFISKPTSFGFSIGALTACKTVSFSVPSINFTCAASAYQSVTWQFNDPASGASNSSSLLNPVHIFTSGGNYQVKLLLHGNCTTDTIVQNINILAPLINVSGTFSLCSNQTAILNASGANSYTWSSGQQTSSISVSPSITAQYTVSGTGTLSGCTSNKTVTVSVFPCTGLEILSENTQFLTLSPNPNSGTFNLLLSEKANIELYDLSGSKILNGLYIAGKHEVHITHLPNGVYILKAQSKTGITVLRVIKEDE